MEAVLIYLIANPQIAAGIAAAFASLGVALSKAGGEKFALARRLFRVLVGSKPE